MSTINYTHLYFDPDAEQAAEQAADKSTESASESAAENNTETTDERDKPRYSDNDVDRIVNKKLAKAKREQEAAVEEAKRLERMNEQERTEHENKKLQDKIAKYEREIARRDMAGVARKMFSDAGISDVDDELIDLAVSDDADTTSARVKSLIKLHRNGVNAEITRRFGQPVPKTGTPASDKYDTKEKIMEIRDFKERQRQMAAHRHLFPDMPK